MAHHVFLQQNVSGCTLSLRRNHGSHFRVYDRLSFLHTQFKIAELDRKKILDDHKITPPDIRMIKSSKDFKFMFTDLSPQVLSGNERA